MDHFIELSIRAMMDMRFPAQPPRADAAYVEKEVVADLIAKVPRAEARPGIVENYVTAVGMKSPADAHWVAQRFLTPEETRNAFVKLMIRAQSSGQSRDDISKRWAALDPEFRKSLGF